jgi:hypothetical protein
MSEVLDLKKSVLDLKADEQMIAFAGFSVRAPDQSAGAQGVLKVAAFSRKDGSGYLTLTFVVDTREDEVFRSHLAELFNGLTEKALMGYRGPELKMMVAIPLGALAHIPDWYLEEYSLYFRKLRGREKRLLQDLLLPAFSSILGLSFDATEWLLDEDIKPGSASPKMELKDRPRSPKSFFQRWFGVK